MADSDEILSHEEQIKLYDSDIDRLCNFTDAELTELKANSKLSGISLIRVKELAIHLSLNRCFKKSILIDNIIKKRKRMAELAAVHVAEDIVNDSDDESSRFISNRNTFPWICNIIFSHPDALIRSALLASKYALQNKETNQNQPIFKECREKFNDYNFNSGGLISNHDELIEATYWGRNWLHFSGLMTPCMELNDQNWCEFWWIQRFPSGHNPEFTSENSPKFRWNQCPYGTALSVHHSLKSGHALAFY